MSEAKSSKILIFALISVTVLFVFAAVKRSVPAVASYSRIVRVIETAPFDVPHPAGLTYVKDGDFFAYLPAATAGNLAAKSALMQVDFSDVPQGKVDLPLALSNPLNIAYNPLAKKLLVFDDLNNEMIECGLDDRNLPVPVSLQRLAVNHFGLVGANGMTVDPTSGDLFVLDGDGRHFIKIEVSTDQAAQGAAAYQSGLLSRTFVPQSPRGGFRGIAYNPTDGHLYALQPDSRRLFELTVQGRIISVRDLSKIPMQNPQGMDFAPSGDRTDDPSTTSLYLADSGLPDTNRSGQIIEVTLAAPLAAEATFQSSLIQTIDTSLFYPPSPDPAGMAWHNLTEKILVSDSEVNEMKIFTGDNLFAMTVDGSLYDSLSSVGYSEEPTGLAFNTANDHLFVADDNERRINEVDPGSDGLFDTADDQVTFFDTRLFDSYDPEGVAFDAASQTLFIADGVNSEVYIVQRGGNGVFDGVPPEGDDQVSQFDTAGLGITDPEGIEFNDINGHLYLAGNGDKDLLLEVTAGGAFVQGIDISAANARAPSGLACGPGSFDPETLSIFLSDRGIDNGADPNENDGKIYEMTLPVSESDDVAPLVTIFDLPDTWTSLTVPVLSFAATDNIGVTGYLATESESPPAAGDVGWSPTPPDSYTFAADGTKTLYGWARDAAGNVSAALSDTVVISLSDTTPPQITAFDLPETSSFLTVSILSFSATDDTSVSGYLATENGSTPTADDPGWSTTPPTEYTFASEGSQSLYGWARDAAGNISAGASDTVFISTGGGQQLVVERQVAAGNDDAEESTTGDVDLNSSDLELGTENGSPQTVGMRFADLAIPQGAAIVESYIQFTVDEKNSVDTSLVLRGLAADNAAPFDNTTGNLSSRVQTSASVSWSPAPWTVIGQAEQDQRTPNLSSLLQEIINRPGWAEGNALGVLITGSGERTAESFDGQSQSAPVLHVAYQTGGSGDTTPPTMISFDLPETSTSLTVAISSFSATDDTGVTGYLATESGSTPAVDDAGWSATPPDSYTFTAEGTKTLYGWAKDAAGNVSTGVSDTVVITLPDSEAPQVTAFELPETADTLTVAISSFTATDDTGVTGYLATESGSTPAVDDPGWSGTPPTQYTFASDGTKTLYGWAKDAAGNVSTGLSDTVVITLPDSEAPQVTAFELPETATSLTVAISSFTATDDTGVTGYLATESGSTPAVDDPGWSGTPPTQYTFAAAGSQTLYGWARDAAGNVSTGASDTVVITLLDTEAPQVTAFDLPETATTLTVAISSFTATDDTGVTGYLATESGSTPAVDDAGWSATPPTQYTFASDGTKTLYGWARDAAGNISTGVSDTVVITLPDTEAPQVTAFDLPETATTLTVAINSFTATDDTGVTGYLATESGSTPAVDDAGWSATPPTQYTFASDGTKTLYGWARDAAGNVSTGVSDTVVITLPDTEAPQVTAFELPETATTLTVAISSFTATDDTGVTGYLATENSTAPAVDDPGWSATPPTDYTFANGGSQTLYGWAKDAAGNVSTGVSDTVVISLGPMHVGDLDGSVRLRGKSPNWDAYVTVTVHDQNHSGVPGVTVSAIWSGDANLTGSGVTDGSGVVTLDTGNISGGSSVTFTVTNLALDGYTYDPVSNHDPDGDSDGTRITVNRPQ